VGGIDAGSFGSGKRRGWGGAPVARGEEEETSWHLGSHAPEVARGEQAWCMKPAGGSGCCWLKEEDARLGRCWATRMGGPSSSLGWRGKERRERWVHYIAEWAES
jgi:hypothetical protein